MGIEVFGREYHPEIVDEVTRGMRKNHIPNRS